MKKPFCTKCVVKIVQIKQKEFDRAENISKWDDSEKGKKKHSISKIMLQFLLKKSIIIIGEKFGLTL